MENDPQKTLEQWGAHVRAIEYCHYISAKKLEHRNMWLGIPTIFLSAAVGTSIFAELETINVVTKIAVGLTSVLAAALAGVQTFLRFSERSEKHRVTAAKYGAIRREIDQSISFNKDSLTSNIVDNIRLKMDKLAEDEPNISSRIWEQRSKANSE